MRLLIFNDPIPAILNSMTSRRLQKMRDSNIGLAKLSDLLLKLVVLVHFFHQVRSTNASALDENIGNCAAASLGLELILQR